MRSRDCDGEFVLLSRDREGAEVWCRSRDYKERSSRCFPTATEPRGAASGCVHGNGFSATSH